MMIPISGYEPLLERNKNKFALLRVCVGARAGESGPRPLRGNINPPYALLNPKEIIGFNNALAVERGYPKISVARYAKDALCLMLLYDEDIIEYAIRRAAQLARHPWGMTFVKKMCEEIMDEHHTKGS